MAAADVLPMAECQALVLHLLRANPNGMRKIEIAAALKIGLHRTGCALAELRKLRLVAFANLGCASTLWAMPEHAAAASKIARRRRLVQTRARERRRLREEAAERAFAESLRMTQRIVPAGRFPPPECIAANSVFNLAQRA